MIKSTAYYLLSLILYSILAPIGTIYGLINNPRGTSRKLIKLAECRDRKGNVICAELFNWALLKNSENKFGDGRESISSVIGRNLQAGTLSYFGSWVSRVLDLFDPGHCVRNIGW